MESYFIPQIKDHDCGFACLKILLAIIKKDRDYLYINQDENQKSYSYMDLISLGSSYGVELFGGKVEKKEDIDAINNLPFIATISEISGVNHAVVVLKVKKKSIVFIDPAYGKRRMNKKKFLSFWDQTALIIDRTYNYPKPKIVNLEHKKKSKWGFILEAISYLCLGVGVMFIDDAYQYFIPVAFLILFFIFNVLEKIILMQNMQKDDEYILNLIKDKHVNHYKFISRLANYKKEKFSNPISLIGQSIIAIFLITITIINSFYNIFLILVPFTLTILDYLIFDPYMNKKSALLENREKMAIKGDDASFIASIQLIQKKSYELSAYHLVKKYSFAFLMAVSAFLTMWYENSHLTLAYTIFYFSIEMVLSEQFYKILTYKRKRNNYLRAKIKLINIINEK